MGYYAYLEDKEKLNDREDIPKICKDFEDRLKHEKIMSNKGILLGRGTRKLYTNDKIVSDYYHCFCPDCQDFTDYVPQSDVLNRSVNDALFTCPKCGKSYSRWDSKIIYNTYEAGRGWCPTIKQNKGVATCETVGMFSNCDIDGDNGLFIAIYSFIQLVDERCVFEAKITPEARIFINKKRAVLYLFEDNEWHRVKAQGSLAPICKIIQSANEIAQIVQNSCLKDSKAEVFCDNLTHYVSKHHFSTDDSIIDYLFMWIKHKSFSKLIDEAYPCTIHNLSNLAYFGGKSGLPYEFKKGKTMEEILDMPSLAVQYYKTHEMCALTLNKLKEYVSTHPTATMLEIEEYLGCNR